MNQDQSSNQQTQEEFSKMKVENEQLKTDMSWLANQAKQSKLQNDKAIADLQAYTQILRGMEKKLVEVEAAKEMTEKELREVKQSFRAAIQQHNM